MVDKLPHNLLSSKELEGRLRRSSCPLSAEEITAFAKAGVIPAYWWQFRKKKAGPFFTYKEIIRWVLDNKAFVHYPGGPRTGEALLSMVEHVRLLEERIEALEENSDQRAIDQE